MTALDLKLELNEPVTKYMSKNVCRVSASDTISEAARKMKKDGVTAALVFVGNEPSGIITERDILYKVVALGTDPTKVVVMRVMSSPVETMQDTAKTGTPSRRCPGLASEDWLWSTEKKW